jgi:hypothetical protein
VNELSNYTAMLKRQVSHFLNVFGLVGLKQSIFFVFMPKDEFLNFKYFLADRTI